MKIYLLLIFIIILRYENLFSYTELLFPPVCISSLICSHVERKKKIWKKIKRKTFSFQFLPFFSFFEK